MLASVAGCSNPVSMATSAGRMAYQTMKGAQADVTPIRIPDRQALATYRSLQLGQVTTDVPPICTPKIMDKVREGLREGLSKESVRKAFPGDGPTLKVNIVTRFCKAKGAIGGEGRLDWLVTLVDGTTGEEVGILHVEGVSGSPLQHGVSDMAEENTGELVKFLRKKAHKEH
jgi:hypothetical protein